MPIRKVLLPLTGTAAGAAALGTAALVARRWDAHIAALHVRMDSRDVAPLAGEGLSGAMIEDMMSATERESGNRARAIRALFEQAMQAEQIPVTDLTPPVRLSASFSTTSGREDDHVAQQARLADLTIVPHPDAGEDVSSSDALHAVLFDSGRPVLIAPRAAPASVGERVCIAWNGTAESATAVFGALPWLQRAQAVRVLASEDYQRRGPAAEELRVYLALHGIQSDIRVFRSIDREVGAGLLAAAQDFGADLMAMGAYSHSRLRQLILGGVTRHVLEHAALPVMMNR
ncbi:universal stress protein [Acidisphaera rubrifaciens]|uniref:Universal stress protein UspA n=1 Tax=Acidisphaera rubrifaciens HS-AP3 TaxID=1231350 RepID=A0A0D6P674_9PROT|nr:universal stress protein [Acidisphaera rubrifaciens]GAN76698.1 universal stress protein UspA [Acidisphaera rubrifaciens HS-AP3]